MKRYLVVVGMIFLLFLTMGLAGIGQASEPQEIEPMIPNIDVTVNAKVSLDGEILEGKHDGLTIKFSHADGTPVEPEYIDGKVFGSKVPGAFSYNLPAKGTQDENPNGVVPGEIVTVEIYKGTTKLQMQYPVDSKITIPNYGDKLGYGGPKGNPNDENHTFATPFTVTTPQVTKIVIDPSGSVTTVASGSKLQFKANGTYDDGTTGDITNSVTWNSSSPTTATIDASGNLTGIKVGSTDVTASAVTTSGTVTSNVVNITVTPGPAENLVKVAGDSQTGKVGAALANPFVAQITDANGNGVPGVNVTFTVTDGSGNFSGETAKTVATDASGNAAVTLTLGTNAGENEIVATPALETKPLTLTFTATALPGDAHTLVYVSGKDQTDTVNTVLGEPFKVRVQDQYGNPVKDIPITYTVTVGDGSFNGSKTKVVDSDNAGVSQTNFTLDKKTGINTVTATNTTLSGSPITFSATGMADAPATMSKHSGDGQTGTVGERLANPLEVKVIDQYDNPVEGEPVDFDTNDGSVAPQNTVTISTTAEGIAAVNWTLPTVTGTYNATATKTGLAGSPVTFTASAGPGAATSIVADPSSNTKAQVDASGNLIVQVEDKYGNPVDDGAEVTFTAAGIAYGYFKDNKGDPTTTATATTTNGKAGVTFYFGEKSGTNSVDISCDSVTQTGLFPTTTEPGAATRIETTTDNPQISCNDPPGKAEITATIQDKYGNTVTTFKNNVTFTLSDAGYGALDTTTKQPDNGQAIVNYTALTATCTINNPPVTITASSPGLTQGTTTVKTVPFSLDNKEVYLVAGDSYEFEAMGGSADTTWTNEKTAAGALSTTKGKKSTYTAEMITTECVTDTVTITDTIGGQQMTSEGTVTVCPSLVTTLTQPIYALTGTDLSVTELKVSGGYSPTAGDPSYNYQIVDASPNTIIKNFIDSSGNVVLDASMNLKIDDTPGEFGVKISDNTLYNGAVYQANAITITPIKVVGPLGGVPGNIFLDNGKTYQINALGGSGQYAYESDNGAVAVVDANGEITAVGNGTAVVEVNDERRADYIGDPQNGLDMNINVNAPAEIRDEKGNPITRTPTVNAGKSTKLTVVGGTNSYAWSATGPDGSDVTGTTLDLTTGDTTTFTAPKTGEFAGSYNVKLSDNNTGITVAQQIHVPMNITPDNGKFAFLKSDGIQTSTVNGAPGTATFNCTIADENRKQVLAEEIPKYGTLAGTATNTPSIDPNNGIETPMAFMWLCEVTHDNIPANLKTVYGDVSRIIPTTNYTLNLITPNPVADGAVSATIKDSSPTNTKKNVGQEIEFEDMPASSNTYTYYIEDSTGTYANKTATSNKTKVDVNLVTNAATITGEVHSSPATPLARANIAAYLPAAPATQYPAVTDASGTYSLGFPTGFTPGEYTITANKDGYIGVTQEDIPVTAGDFGKIVDFTGDNALKQQTRITVIAPSLPGDGTVKIDVEADPVFTAAGQLEAARLAGATGDIQAYIFNIGTGIISVIYSAVEDFSLQFKADTSGNPSTVVYKYTKDGKAAAATSSGATAAGGGKAELTADTQTIRAEVPPGGTTKNIVISLQQVEKSSIDAVSTEGSPVYVYEVEVTDASGNVETFNRINITLPFDLSVVAPGDFESGKFVIYKAPTLTQLEAGNATAVPVSDIISTDYVGDGKYGSVTFRVSSLSFFGIGKGGGGGGGITGIGGGGGGGCFIATAAFGSYLNPFVKILRDFRDAVLLTNAAGQAFVRWYYRVSPPIADFIAKSEVAKASVRIMLLPLIGFGALALQIGILWTALLTLALIGALAVAGRCLYRYAR